MPCLKIFTNIPKDKIPRGILPKLIALLAELVKKEPSKFSCVIDGGCALSIAGNAEDSAIIASLESIGNLGPVHNKRITKGLTDFVQTELQVTPERFFLTFYDLQDFNIGISGTTVDAL